MGKSIEVPFLTHGVEATLGGAGASALSLSQGSGRCFILSYGSQFFEVCWQA